VDKKSLFFKAIDFLNGQDVDAYDGEEDITSWLLGELLSNRLGGIAFYKLKDTSFSKKAKREFLWTLECVYNSYVQKNNLFFSHLSLLGDILKNAQFKYALLKGAFLTSKLYPIGLRVSNDIDILVHQDDVSSCQQLLKDGGFIQGFYHENIGIIPATRQEILHSRLNFGETIEWNKILDGNRICIDVNFSVDYKALYSYDVVKDLLSRVVPFDVNNHSLSTLNDVDFLIHLCCHLYKEATTYDWLVWNRDTDLYKYCDIYLFLSRYQDDDFLERLGERIKILSLEKECFYALSNTIQIFHEKRDLLSRSFLQKIQPDNLDFMKQIYWPSKKIFFERSLDFIDWIFCKNKTKNLRDLRP
jgi:hypothetical protein